MAEANTTEIFNCSREEFFKIVSDYEKYPQFLPEVKAVKITKTTPTLKEMEYSVSMIKTFSYRLKVTEKINEEVVFEFIGGDVFKSMRGEWKLKDKGKNQVEVDYKVEASFGLLVPGPMAKTLVSVNLPIMMANFKKRVKEVYGK